MNVKMNFSDLDIKDNKIIWKNSIGKIVEFKYNDVVGCIKILEYENSRVKVQYLNDTYTIKTSHLKDGHIGEIIGLTSHHKTQEEFEQEIKLINPEYKIVGEYKNSKTKLEMICDKGHHFMITPSDLLSGNKCGVCRGLQVTIDNCVATMRPDLIVYFESTEDAYKVTCGSSKLIKFKCPICGVSEIKNVYGFVQNGINCLCKSHISYSQKFVCSMLNQLNIGYVTEKSFDWSFGKRYDIYIPTMNCIIENNGMQHYKYTGFNRSLEEEINNDLIKEKQAVANGVEYYICLDCRYSKLEWIKKSILSSELYSLFRNINDIDWGRCNNDALKNDMLFSSIIDLWNGGLRDTKAIKKELNLSLTTVCFYLQKGYELGICDYTSKIIKQGKMGKKEWGNSSRVKVICDGIIYSSIKDCSIYYNVCYSQMCKWLRDDKIPIKYKKLGLSYY